MEPEVPSGLDATLRPYQLEGYQWISRLAHWGAGGCLADDMGLGKTVQTIAFLLSRASEGPSLVLAPTSVVPNWESEIRKFAPSLRPLLVNNVKVLFITGNYIVAMELSQILETVNDDLFRYDFIFYCRFPDFLPGRLRFVFYMISCFKQRFLLSLNGFACSGKTDLSGAEIRYDGIMQFFSNQITQLLFLGKADLPFGRMYIDIHQLEVS